MKTPLPLPSQEYLQYHFYYNPKTGKFYRRFAKNNGKIGQCSVPKKDGYLRQRVNGAMFYTARLIWMYMTGEDPGQLEVDHKDRDRSNYSWSNLRLGTRRDNLTNQDSRGFSRDGSLYRTRIMVDGVSTDVGWYSTPGEARAAYLKAKEELHPFYAA